MLAAMSQELIQFVDFLLDLVPHFRIPATLYTGFGVHSLAQDGSLQAFDLPSAGLVVLQQPVKLTLPDLTVLTVRLGLFLQSSLQFRNDLGILGRLLSGALIQFLILLCNTDELTLHDGNVALLAGQFLADDSLLQLHFLNKFPLLVLVGFQRITGLLLLSLQPLLSDDLYEHGTLLLLPDLPVQRVHIPLQRTGFCLQLGDICLILHRICGQFLDSGIDFRQLGLLFPQFRKPLPVGIQMPLLLGSALLNVQLLQNLPIRQRLFVAEGEGLQIPVSLFHLGLFDFCFRLGQCVLNLVNDCRQVLVTLAFHDSIFLETFLDEILHGTKCISGLGEYRSDLTLGNVVAVLVVQREVLDQFVVVLMVFELCKLGSVLVFRTPIQIFTDSSLGIANLFQLLIEVEVLRDLAAVLINGTLASAGIGLQTGIVRELRNLVHVSNDRVQTGLVVRDNHPDIGIAQQLLNMLFGNTNTDCTAVLAVAISILNLLCGIVIEGLACPDIVAVSIQTGSDAALRNGRDQRHVDLYASQTELLDEQCFLGVGMCRQLGCSQIVNHLGVVKHHSGNVVRERLDSDTAYLVSLGRSPCSCFLDDLVQILYITECSLGAAGSLLGIVQLQNVLILGLHRIESLGGHEVTTQQELSAFRMGLDVLGRLVLYCTGAVFLHNLIQMGEVQLRGFPGIDSVIYLLDGIVSAEVEMIDTSLLAFRNQAVHQIVVELGEGVCHGCLPETLGIHEAQRTGCLHSMITDDLVDLDHALLAQFKVINDTALGHLIEDCIQGSALLADQREVQVHLIVAVGSNHAEHRSAVGVPNDFCIRPCAERCILILEVLADLVHLLDAVPHFLCLLLSQPFAGDTFIQVQSECLSAFFFVGTGAQHHGAVFRSHRYRFAVLSKDFTFHTGRQGIQSRLVVLTCALCCLHEHSLQLLEILQLSHCCAFCADGFIAVELLDLADELIDEFLDLIKQCPVFFVKLSNCICRIASGKHSLQRVCHEVAHSSGVDFIPGLFCGHAFLFEILFTKACRSCLPDLSLNSCIYILITKVFGYP